MDLSPALAEELLTLGTATHQLDFEEVLLRLRSPEQLSKGWINYPIYLYKWYCVVLREVANVCSLKFEFFSVVVRQIISE